MIRLIKNKINEILHYKFDIAQAIMALFLAALVLLFSLGYMVWHDLDLGYYF